ncbi:MAG: hypothetical protein K2Y39_16530 [Candidatus Obscuribacterales bacterium]|nr:hypothetical protein [Candidatus Obscuribacterales bacterium]
MTASLPLTGKPLAADIIKEVGYRRPLRGEATGANTPVSKLRTAPPLSVQVARPQIELADLSSATAEELSLRAYFLCVATANNHKVKMSALLEQKGLNIEDTIIEFNFMHAIKLLTCASLFLIGIESGGMSNTKRTVDFLLLSFRSAEKISPCSPAKQLIALFGDSSAQDLKMTISRLVVQAFSNGAIDIDSIDKYIEEEITYRKDVSQFACRQSVCVLKDHIPLFV